MKVTVRNTTDMKQVHTSDAEVTLDQGLLVVSTGHHGGTITVTTYEASEWYSLIVVNE